MLVFLTALIGEPSSAQNLAPTFVYVIFWLGLVPVQVLLGNVWPVLNPWLAFAERRRLGVGAARADVDAAARLSGAARRLAGGVPPLLLRRARARLRRACQPARAGARDRALQLRRRGSGWPRTAAGRGSSAGRRSRSTSACSRGSRRSASATAGSSCGCRSPGLAGREATPGMLAFIAVMLGSVGFDGFSRSPFWQDLRADLEGPYVLDVARHRGADLDGALRSRASSPASLVVALAYLGAIRIAHAGGRRRAAARAGVPAQPRADRARLRGRALLHAAA